MSLAGNELSGNGVGTSITAEQYALDVAALHDVVYNAYKKIEPKPLVIAPGGFYDANWFNKFISKSGKSIDVVTHHIYNLGSGTLHQAGKYSLCFTNFNEFGYI